MRMQKKQKPRRRKDAEAKETKRGGGREKPEAQKVKLNADQVVV